MFLTSGWVALTVLVWACAVAMVLLGRWQLRVSNRKHFDLQNFGYALQWWVFSLFAVLFWAKVVRDTWRGRQPHGAALGGELVVRTGGSRRGRVGAVDLVTASDAAGAAPVVYRGYVMPQSATSPARSEDDPFHAAYNDYLWALAMADLPGSPDGAGQRPSGRAMPPGELPPTADAGRA